MEYSSGYLRALKHPEDDTVSMLSAHAASTQYHAYQPPHSRDSSGDSMNGTSFSISPAALQQSLSPISPLAQRESSRNVEASLFESRAVLNRPYQAPVAYENAAPFRLSQPNGPKVQFDTITDVGNESGAPDLGSRKYFRHPRHILEPWISGFWIRLPRWGIGAVVGVTLLTSASVGILIVSNDDSIDQWKVQPQVLLSMFEMFNNAFISFALVDGMVIQFWKQLLHGTTLSAMHDTYESMFLFCAVNRTMRLRFNRVATACLLVAFSMLRGPFFQRASSISVRNSQGQEEEINTVYKTDVIFLAFGVIFSFAGIAAVLPLYTGWWELGRNVSFNPLELARAFGAPIMEGVDGNAGAERVVIERGGMAVRYGAVERHLEEKRLRIEESSRTTVRTPRQGEVFG